MSGAVPQGEPEVGVVIVNWNNPEDTITCLDSLHDAQPRPGAVVLVDNASHDDSVARVQTWAKARDVGLSLTEPGNPETQFPQWLTLIRSPSNLGFAGGNNLGLMHLRRTKATHFLLLNNDATVARNYFSELDRGLRTSPEAGLVGGTIYHHPDRERVWYAGGREIPYRALVAHLYDVPESPAPIPTEFVTGCAMTISRMLLDRIGGLPECYFPGYSEDAEYSRRARDAGFQVLYAPKAIVYHKVGATAGHAKTSPSVLQAQVRHRVFYVRRTFRGFERLVALLYLAITKPGKALVEAVAGRPGMGMAVLRGTLEGFLRRV